jgi:hypothetical protein
LVASFVDAEVAAFLGPDDVGGFPFISNPMLCHKPVKGYPRVGRGIKEATYSGSG